MSRDIFEHGDFFSCFSLPSTRKRRFFMDLKRRFSKTVPRVNIFGNAGLSLFFGRTKTDNTMMSRYTAHSM